MKQICVESYHRNGYIRLMKWIYDIDGNPKYGGIENRLEIIKFLSLRNLLLNTGWII